MENVFTIFQIILHHFPTLRELLWRQTKSFFMKILYFFRFFFHFHFLYTYIFFLIFLKKRVVSSEDIIL